MQTMKKILPYLVFPFIIGGAIALAYMTEEKKAYVNFYDEHLKNYTIPCLSFTIYPPDSSSERALKNRYPFQKNCPWKLTVTTKENIHCNSNQNSDRKALSAFPNSFLRMEIRKGFTLRYSYYVDLVHPADSDDILEGFERISKDLKLE